MNDMYYETCSPWMHSVWFPLFAFVWTGNHYEIVVERGADTPATKDE